MFFKLRLLIRWRYLDLIFSYREKEYCYDIEGMFFKNSSKFVFVKFRVFKFEFFFMWSFRFKEI